MSAQTRDGGAEFGLAAATGGACGWRDSSPRRRLGGAFRSQEGPHQVLSSRGSQTDGQQGRGLRREKVPKNRANFCDE